MPSTTCLIGNGLSVSYSPELSVNRLTRMLRQRFSDLGGDRAETALSQVARDLRGEDREAFEQLLGPLESLSRAIPGLPGLASLASLPADQIGECGTQLADFANEVHRIGLGIVLGLVAEHSVGVGGGRVEGTVVEVCRELGRAAAPDEASGSILTVATLNYDGLLTAGLLRLHDDGLCALSDMGHGQLSNRLSIAREVPPSGCLGIRAADDLPGDVQLLHLHGSLGWLTDPDTGDVWKFELPELRGPHGQMRTYWTHLKTGSALLLPKVVLTDKKTRAVAEWPFSLAYLIFESRLRTSERWLIGGYGFGDEPVNQVLRRAYQRRQTLGSPPRVLVIGHGPAVADRARHAIGHPPQFVDTDGFPGAVHGAAFADWLGT